MSQKEDNLCLVLGGCGFLGSVVTRHLAAQGIKVRVLDKEGQNTYRLKSVLSKFELLYGDFSNLGDLSKALEGVSTVLHFIGTTIPQTSMNDIEYDVETNVLPTVRLLELMNKKGAKRIIFASSGGTVYGISESNQPLSEKNQTEPISAYGISKLMIEKYIKLFSFNYNLPYAILRFSNPYGPSQHAARPQGAVGVFLNKMLRGEKIAVWGDGTVIRDYLYEDDIGTAVTAILNNPALQGVFNVGAGSGTSLNQLVDLIKKTFSVDCSLQYEPERKFDVPFNVLDIQKISKETGWKPEYTLLDGLNKMKSAIDHSSIKK